MAESKEEKVSGLLQQGLEFYGTGDVARAFLLWTEALELDPGNEEALDYMRDADRRAKPRGGGSEIRGSSLVDDARRLLHAENEDAALELLTRSPANRTFEAEAMIELVRASLFQRYRADLGDLAQVPRIVQQPGSDLTSRNLPASAGFLLSMIDGATPLSDLMSLSGMDRFEAMRSVCRMRDAGILEWDQ
jgi:hypothetical protein